MKKILSFTFILLFSIVIFAQKTISGTVKNDDGKPLASASVTIEEIGKNAILEYAITDAKGNYKVTFTSNDEKILVKVKAFNHQTITENYNNATQTLNFVLQEKATEIKEVKLKTKLITKRGDTISYDLKSFESKADRSLADVLKKIPGIEVNKDGSILYQGEQINKFYVNGKDLMEGSYGLINNSLPKDAVQKVEVLENHQPVKILQDKLSSENAAINVQLKKSITMTGRGETSLGVAPSLWNVKLTPMLFTQKYQWVLNYKTNNMGEEVEKENNILAFGNRFEGMRRNFSENSWLSVENAATPQNVPVKRYLLNNVHYLSANVLTNLSKQWELKANASYSNNAIERESMVKTFNANNDLTNTSLVSNNFYTNQAKGEIIFSKNANKSFFKNTTTYNGLWNGDLANTRNNNIASNQRTKTPSNSFQNSLSAIIPWKERLVNAMSFISYRDDKQDLFINPANYVVNLQNVDGGNNSEVVHQFLNLKTFEAIHSASIGLSKKNWTFTPEVGLNYTNNKLLSDVNGVTGNTIQDYQFKGVALENDIDFKNLKPYAQMMVNYKREGLDVNLSFPVNFNNISATGTNNLDKTLNKITYDPRFFMRYDLTSFWKFSTFAGITNSFGSINDVYNGFILLSAKNLSSRNTDIQQTRSNFVGSRLEYRNPLNNIFFNVSYNFNDRTNNVTFLNELDEASQQFIIKGYNLENNSKTNSFNHALSAYVYPFKNHTLGFTWDELHSSNRERTAKNAFFDLSYQYSMSEEKIDLELKVLNITNNNVFENVTFNSTFNQTSYTTINIRPRQVVLTLKFNFK